MRLNMNTKVKIKEYKNGNFQVFINDEILRPKTLDLYANCQKELPFMFFDTLEDAKKGLKGYFDLLKGMEVVNVYDFDIKKDKKS